MALHDRSVKLIHLESGRYPVSVMEFMSLTPGYAWGEVICDELFQEHGYAVVYKQDPPVADVVTEGPPVSFGGVYLENWIARSYTEQELQSQKEQRLKQTKDAALSNIKVICQQTIEQGLPYSFDGFGVQHIQIRDRDLGRLAGLAHTAAMYPDRVYYFRTLENQMIPVSAESIRDIFAVASDASALVHSLKWELLSRVERSSEASHVLSWDEIQSLFKGVFFL